MGYKFSGRFPDEPKLILAGGPHTSNWDLLLAIATILSLGVRINFMMKKEAFKFPFKNLFLWLGGIQVDRSNPKKMVLENIKAFETRDKIWIAILPEGTRKSAPVWKAGFVRIARQVNVPIFTLGLDARTKTLYFDRIFETAPDYGDERRRAPAVAAEFREYILSKYSGMNPENN